MNFTISDIAYFVQLIFGGLLLYLIAPGDYCAVHKLGEARPSIIIFESFFEIAFLVQQVCIILIIFFKPLKMNEVLDDPSA